MVNEIFNSIMVGWMDHYYRLEYAAIEVSFFPISQFPIKKAWYSYFPGMCFSILIPWLGLPRGFLLSILRTGVATRPAGFPQLPPSGSHSLRISILGQYLIPFINQSISHLVRKKRSLVFPFFSFSHGFWRGPPYSFKGFLSPFSQRCFWRFF